MIDIAGKRKTLAKCCLLTCLANSEVDLASRSKPPTGVHANQNAALVGRETSDPRGAEKDKESFILNVITHAAKGLKAHAHNSGHF